MRRRFAGLLAAALLSLTACSGPSNDPRQGGLIGGLQGVYGGSYDQRIQERNDQLASQQRLHQDLELESVALAREHQLADARLAAARQHLLELERGLQSLDAQVAGKRAQSEKQRQEAAAMQTRIAQVQKKIREQHNVIDDLDRAGGSTARPEEYQSLRRDQERLDGEYNALQAGKTVASPR